MPLEAAESPSAMGHESWWLLARKQAELVVGTMFQQDPPTH